MTDPAQRVSHGQQLIATRRYPLTAIILTYNEASNVDACLDHLDWVDDVVLVDSHSSDETVEIAQRARPDLRIFSHPFRDFGDQRNWALDHAGPRYGWVFFLDADEHCNSECAQAIQRAVENSGGNAGFYLTCRNYFLGRWIRRCTLYPSWQLRLLKLGEVRYRKEGHGQREVTDGPLGYIQQPYDHFGFSKGIAHWIVRHNAYSTNECDLIHRLRNERLDVRDLLSGDPVVRRRCLKRIAVRLPGRALNRFFYLYVIRRGFLDGYPGLVFCFLRLAHEIHIMAKRAELQYAGAGHFEVVERGDTADGQESEVELPRRPR